MYSQIIIQLNVLAEKEIIGMRLFNLVITAVYGLNIFIDAFSTNGAFFTRLVLVLLAWADFIIFVYVVLNKLSTFLNFPILSLPKNLGKGGEGQQIPNNGDTDRESGPSFPDTKLESSMDNTFENSPEKNDIETNTPQEAPQTHTTPYAQDLEFDDFPKDNGTPQTNEDVNIKIEDNTIEDPESEEEKEGDVSYHNDFDGEDEFEI